MKGPRHVQFMYETGGRLSSQWIPINILYSTCSASSTSGLVRQAFETFNIPSDMHMTFDPIVLFEVTSPQPDATTVNVSVGDSFRPLAPSRNPS
ncbi:hypothetical protein BC826DRAFT_1042122 [Russula brevipes]|nr:hypothetical protein BC826DRAFT_1042122 [Russula brevipes]